MEQHYRARVLMFAAGICSMAFGIALSCRAELGTTPISSVPLVVSMCTGWSVGQVTVAMNLAFIFVQPLLLRAFFWHALLGQLMTTLFFGTFIDVFMYLLAGFQPQDWAAKWLACLASTVILSFGVFLEVRARLFLAAGEGLVTVLAFVAKRNFSLLKNCFDILLVLISAIIAAVNFGTLRGVGAGTLTAAVLTGRMVYVYEKRLHFFDRWKVPDK